jgi:general secretion pathway protein G
MEMDRRSGSRGFTPIGAALAVLVFGVGASCLWWAHQASASHDAERSTQSDAEQISLAARTFRAQHGDGCPTLSQLQEESLLSRSARQDDAWGNRFRVRCEGEQIVVQSAGPDGVANTADDLRIPR